MTHFSSLLEKINNVAKHVTCDAVFDISTLLQLAERPQNTSLEGRIALAVNVVKVLLKSPTAYALLYDLAEKEFEIDLVSLEGYESAISERNKTIYLKSSDRYPYLKKEEVRLSVALAHQLRRAWQISENYHAKLTQSSLDFTRAYRLEEADAESVMIKIIWELRQDGYVAPWYELLSTASSDLALSYSSLIETDPKADIDGRAMRCCFDLWATDFKRVQACDDLAVMMLSLEPEHPLYGMRLVNDRYISAEPTDIISALLS